MFCCNFHKNTFKNIFYAIILKNTKSGQYDYVLSSNGTRHTQKGDQKLLPPLKSHNFRPFVMIRSHDVSKIT